MKKLMLLLIVFVCVFMLTACDLTGSDSEQSGGFTDNLLDGLNNAGGDTSQAGDANSENANTENNSQPDNANDEILNVDVSDFAIVGETLRTDIDYGPYNAVIKAYGLAYGEMVTPYSTYYTETYDSAGLCYMNLVDLDRNGILELILVAVEEPIEGTLPSEIGAGFNADKYYNNAVKVYTISDFEGEQSLQYLGSTPLSDYEGPVSSNLVVEYRPNEFETNLVVTLPRKSWDWDFEYREYFIEDSEYFGYTAVVSEFDQMNGLGDFITEGGETLTRDEFNEIYGTQEDSIAHYISNQTIQIIDDIRDINTKTISFLSNYSNGEDHQSLMNFNDGAFVLREIDTTLYPPEYPVIDFFTSVVEKDYELLANALSNNNAENVMAWAYNYDSVPGFIISNFQITSYDDVSRFNIGIAESMEMHYEARTDVEQMSVIVCDVMQISDAQTPAPAHPELKGEKIRYFFMVESQDSSGENWTIDAFFTDEFEKENENAINVMWISTIYDEFESVEEYRGYVLEAAYPYLPDEEAYIAMIGDDLTSKLLLIETTTYADEFYIYENINGGRGELHYDHYDHFSMQAPMIIAVGGDTFPSIQVVCVTQMGIEYSYVVDFDEDQFDLIYNDYAGEIAKIR